MTRPHAAQRVPTLGLVPREDSGFGTVGLLGPGVSTHLGGSPVSAGGADALLLVVGISTAPAATNMGGLLPLTH